MLATAITTLFMTAEVGPQFAGHFAYIHLLSLMVLFYVQKAYISARTGKVRDHQLSMLGVYIGGLLVAGSLALMPGRLLHGWLL